MLKLRIVVRLHQETSFHLVTFMQTDATDATLNRF